MSKLNWLYNFEVNKEVKTEKKEEKISKIIDEDEEEEEIEEETEFKDKKKETEEETKKKEGLKRFIIRTNNVNKLKEIPNCPKKMEILDQVESEVNIFGIIDHSQNKAKNLTFRNKNKVWTPKPKDGEGGICAV